LLFGVLFPNPSDTAEDNFGNGGRSTRFFAFTGPQDGRRVGSAATAWFAIRSPSYDRKAAPATARSTRAALLRAGGSRCAPPRRRCARRAGGGAAQLRAGRSVPPPPVRGPLLRGSPLCATIVPLRAIRGRAAAARTPCRAPWAPRPDRGPRG